MSATTTEVQSIELTATRTRIDLASPEANSLFSAESVVYVTQNSKGKLRAALTNGETKLKVGETVKATHATRKGSYGDLTIVGRLQNGRKSGEVPEGKLALRTF